jgi:tetratricopeptide (TPR) repeat protein
MLDSQIPSGGPPEAEAPVVMIPVPAEDVARRDRRFKALLAAAVVGLGIAGWYVYQRTVDPVRAQQAYTDGVRLVRATRYEQAILNFDRAIDLKADFVDAYRMRGRAYVSIGKPDSAIPDLTKVMTFQPSDATVFVERGFAYVDKKDWSHATADANRALELNPKLARAYNLRATATRSTGDPLKALEDFSRAVELEPDLDNYFQRAATYQLLNNHKQAVDDYTQALTVSPDQPHIYFARAESRAALGDSRGAQDDIRIGRQIDGW